MINPALNYSNLKISPFEIQEIKELQIIRTVNEHATLVLTGVVAEAKRDKYTEPADSATEINVELIGVKVKNPFLFRGLVTNVRVKMVRDVCYIEIEAVSHTYQLDLKRISRSFQNVAMTYSDLIKQVTAAYPGVDVKDTVSRGAQLGSFVMQYQETDWEFLKRMASRFHAGLIPAATFDQPKFFFGVPEGQSQGKLDNFNYSVSKDLKKFKTTAQTNAGVEAADFTYYEVETNQILDLGDRVDFHQKPLYVYQAVSVMRESELKHYYLLTSPGGFAQPLLYNYSLVGASVQGKIIGVAKDNVRVHLEVDSQQAEQDAYWFPYSSVYTAEGNGGWYCMPELGDYVRIYFPDHQEANAVAISSVRKDNDSETNPNNKVGNPDVKCFRTKSGKELVLAPGEILISAKDGELFIRLSDNDGIQINSNLKIELRSKETVVIDAKNVMIAAEEKLELTCKDSNITMDGTTAIKGFEVKSN